jgi:hypothetical protein
MTNCLSDIYDTYAAFETAIELIDDTKIVGVGFPVVNGRQKFVIVKKGA